MEQDHMQQRELPPPSYNSHDPKTLTFPSTPVAEPQPAHHERRLPPLPVVQPEPRMRVEESHSWPSGNPLTAYYQPGPSHLSPKGIKPSNGMNSPSTMDLDGPDSRGRRGGSVVSIDDPDVRMAAEALGDLRADFVQSPPQHARTLPPSSEGSQAEPLLSLLTTSHPLIGNTINTSISAYSASKNFSPRFRSGVEYVERRFTPVVNTVGSMGRLTGVEGGVRWFLGGRRPSHHAPSEMDSQEGSDKKRRKVGAVTNESNQDRDLSLHQFTERQELPHRQRAPSQASTIDSLPAYDDHRSPSYESSQTALVTTRSPDVDSSGNASWQSRLVLSTSGLSIAMSDESLKSLRYCLSWLKWANEHIDKVILALKSVLEQYERGTSAGAIENGGAVGEGQVIVRSEAERTALNAKINDLKKDVLKTLKEVVDIVSKYAGGALPENARILVRKHLTSLPQRFKLASSQTTSGQPKNEDTEVTEGAKRVLVLAKEGLDMMSQVSGVLDGTIVSAEEWCERLGRTKAEEGGHTPTGVANAPRDAEKLPIELPPIRTPAATEGF